MTSIPSLIAKPPAGGARVRWGLLCALVVAAAAVSLSACGGSSKPSYCSSLSNLKRSVKDLPNNVLTNGISSLQSALTNIESNAETLVNDAKGDFPNETTAISDSVTALTKTVNQISGTPSAATIVNLGQQVAAVVNSVESFASTASSKCS